MAKRKEQFTFADLEQDAKRFIEGRVRRLGSVGAVRQAYRLDDLVGRYALACAQERFGPTGKVEIWPKRRKLEM